MIHISSVWRSAVNVTLIIPQLLRKAYRQAEEARKDREQRLSMLAHPPTFMDRVAANLCDWALLLSSPAVRVPARIALRQVIFDVVRGTAEVER